MTWWLVSVAFATPPRGPDFNADGFEDLAIGVPDENVGSLVDAGSVVLLYGDAFGADTPAGVNLALYQSGTGVDGTSVAGSPAAGEHFGAALAWGDFDGDCYDDLAVGVPGTTVGAFTGAGVIQIFYGSSTGPSTATDVVWSLDSSRVDGDPDTDDGFGATLAAGDFDGDGLDDLLVGVPGDSDTGSVHVFYGRASGISEAGDFVLTQDYTYMDSIAEPGEQFGYALTTGDFNCDGFDDAAIALRESLASTPFQAGGVHVVYGNWAGLGAVNNDQLITPDLANLDGDPLTNGDFGMVLASGNFNDDRLLSECDDLVISYKATVAGAVNAGGVNLLLGGVGGLTPAADSLISQDGSIIGVPEANDAFGTALAVGDFDNDTYPDLAVGVMENGGEGAVHVIKGASSGIGIPDNVLWDRDETTIDGDPAVGDEFGHHLTTGDYDGDGRSDLVIAGDSAGNGSGEVVIVYSSNLSILTADWSESWTEDDIGATSSSSNDGMGQSLVAARRKDVCP